MNRKDNSKDMHEEELMQNENKPGNDSPSSDTASSDISSEEALIPEEKSELEIMNEKFDDLNDKYLRLYSDFENFRKRTSKERLELYKTAGEEVMNALLPVMDDFDRAIKAVNESDDLKSLKEGVDLIYQKLDKTLQQKGLKAIESSIGKDFDINFHEAITKVPVTDENLKGKIIDELEKGYILGDKVIRYTKVVIGE